MSKFEELYQHGVDYIEGMFTKKYCIEEKGEISRDDVYNRFEIEFLKIFPEEIAKKLIQRVREGKIVPAGSIHYGLGNDTKKCSLSNCYFVPIKEDSIEGIFQCKKEMAKTYKSRGGAGTDFSILRFKGCKVNNSAEISTGAVSFIPGFSNDVHTIGQNHRRGAAIGILDISHPDVPDFIWCKSKPEQVFGRDSITGRVPDLTGFNISLKINNRFMKAVENDEDWTFIFPDIDFEKYDSEWDGDFEKWVSKGYPVIEHGSVNARELLMEISESAWISGDPGVVFIDTIQHWNLCGYDEKLKPVGVNPCLPNWAPVLTPSGYTYFKNLKNKIFIQNEEYDCSDLIKTKELDDVYEITLQSGLKLYANKDHTVKKVEYEDYKSVKIPKDVKLKDLKIGDSLKTDYSKINFDVKRDEWEKGYICGMIYSDGYIYKEKSTNKIKTIDFCLGEKEKPQEDEFKKLIEKNINIPINFRDHTQSDNCRIYGLRQVKPIKTIMSWFECDNKYEIDLFNKSISFQLGFINALIGHDGYVLNKKGKQQQVLIHQSGENGYRILSYIQLILSSLGIYSRLGISNHSKKDKRGYDIKTVWNLQIIDITSFVKVFNIFHKEKKEKIEQLAKDVTSVKEKRVNTLKYCQKIKNIKKLDQQYPVYDIKVPKKEYFVSSGCVVHNCGEQALARYENCLLSALTLFKYVKNPYTNHAEFDMESFTEDVKLGIIFLDGLSDVNINRHPLPEQREADKYGKRIGQEFTGLADMWAMLGYKYGSEKALNFLDDLLYHKALIELETSIQLAKEKGCAESFKTKKSRKKFLNHPYVKRLLSEKILRGKKESLEKQVLEYGLRNSALNTVGPTGTLSIITKNCTSGIEPLYKICFYRKSRVTNQNDRIFHFPLLEYIGEEVLNLSEEEIKEKYNYVEAFDLDYIDRIKTQATVQKWTDASVSSTINLPNDCTVKDIYNIYLESYKHNLKGITVFRDGSKDGLFSSEPGKDDGKENLIESDKLRKHLDHVKNNLAGKQRAYRVLQYWKGIKIYVTITVDRNERPLEIFVTLPQAAGYLNPEDPTTFNLDLYNDRSSTWMALSRLCSLLLRMHMPLDVINKQLNKSTISIGDLPSIILRTLRPFLETDEKVINNIKTNKTGGGYCPACKEYGLINQGGCQICILCGDTKCE